MRLRRRPERVLRVGHRGLAALAPENTLASLAEALRHGVDMVEFDVVDRLGSLRLAHSLGALGSDSVSLDEALDFLVARAAPEVGLVADLKTVAVEAALVDALRRHGVVERTLACSHSPLVLRRLRALEPRLHTGLSYPWDRLGIGGRRPFDPVVRSGVRVLRRTLPRRIGRLLAAAEADAAMVHSGVVSRALAERCHARGAALFAWTVEDRLELERVVAAGVDGVVANDPRLFEV